MHSGKIKGLVNAKLTKEDIDCLKTVLKKYPSNSVSKFIKDLNLLCTIKDSQLRSRKLSSKDIANNRLSLLRQGEIFHSELYRFVENFETYIDFEIPYLNFVKSENNEAKSLYTLGTSKFDRFIDFVAEANKLNSQLIKFIDDLERFNGNESYNLTKKRKSNYDKFYTQIAELYCIYIDKPTSYKDGTFANVITIVNGILYPEKDVQDPSKAILQAIKDIKANPPI